MIQDKYLCQKYLLFKKDKNGLLKRWFNIEPEENIFLIIKFTDEKK